MTDIPEAEKSARILTSARTELTLAMITPPVLTLLVLMDAAVNPDSKETDIRAKISTSARPEPILAMTLPLVQILLADTAVLVIRDTKDLDLRVIARILMNAPLEQMSVLLILRAKTRLEATTAVVTMATREMEKFFAEISTSVLLTLATKTLPVITILVALNAHVTRVGTETEIPSAKISTSATSALIRATKMPPAETLSSEAVMNVTVMRAGKETDFRVLMLTSALTPI